MEPIYQEKFTVSEMAVDRFHRLKPSWILYYTQQIAVDHFNSMNVTLISPEQKDLFWAIIRNKVEIKRLPRCGEEIMVETWPMPTTRSAYPRCMIGYDKNHEEIFRSIGLWVLIERESRKMVLPGKSGVEVKGLVRGNELRIPGSLAPKVLSNHSQRTTGFTELDANGHVNNTRYLDWIADLLPSDFHLAHPIREFTICYVNEILEGQHLDLHWSLLDGPTLMVDATRQKDGETHRVFTAQIQFQ